MKLKARLNNIARNFITGKNQITLDIEEGNVTEIQALNDVILSVEIKRYRNSRSLNANALLWSCLQKIAEALGGDKWEWYLRALRKYGQFTMIEMDKDAVAKFKEMYRECEVVGERNGMCDVLCYYGSSTYDTKEFSVLLDGVIDDMRQAGIETPTDQDLVRALEAWENEQKAKKRFHK